MVKTGKYVYLERDKGGNRNHKIIIKGASAVIGQVASRWDKKGGRGVEPPDP